MIRASAILAIAFCVTGLMRRRTASERHALWVAAVLAAAFLPVLNLLLPEWQPSLARRIAAALPHVERGEEAAGSEFSFRATSIEPAVTGVIRVWPWLWAAGSAAALLVFLLGMSQQTRLAAGSRPLRDCLPASLATAVASQMGCKRTVLLTESARQTMPMTWGVLRPRILVPYGIEAWPEERIRVVIAHELAHIRRLDWLCNIGARTACAVYWFNPLFWIACNRIYRESEHACDDAVINLGVDARDYASHLFEIALALRDAGSGSATALAMARPSTLERRFAALLNAKLNRRAMSRKTMLLIAVATIVAVVPVAAMKISSPAAPVNGPARVDQYTTPPLYSDEGRARGVEGIVTVEVLVSADGGVKRLQVVNGLGYGLDENALLAVRDWRFVPAMRNGGAVEATAQLDVEFSLRNAELNELIANDMATRIGPDVTPPQIVHRVEPQYPASTTRGRAAAAVVLDTVIPEDGTPKIVRVIQSVDWEVDEIAINALKQWRFSAAMKDGRPVKVRMNIAVNFRPN